MVGLVAAGVLTVGLSLPAFADGRCYTGCSPTPVPTPTPVGSVGGGPAGQGVVTVPGVAVSQSPPAAAPVATQSVPSSGGLPLTGADIEELVGLAVVLLVAGAAVARVSRRRARLGL